MATTLRRDPFARADLVRYVVPASARRACAWCGSRPGRFIYRWEGDSIRPLSDPLDWPERRAFCSRSCCEEHTR